MLGQRAAQERSSDRRGPKEDAKEAEEDGPLGERDDDGNQVEARDEDAGRTSASYSTADD